MARNRKVSVQGSKMINDLQVFGEHFYFGKCLLTEKIQGCLPSLVTVGKMLVSNQSDRSLL